MILVTIGSQEPFDRLLLAIDRIAAELPEHSFLVQTGNTKVEMKHVNAVPFIPPAEFKSYIDKSSLVIAHAGVGTMLTVLETAKPLIVFPRLAQFRETRDDHQHGTAKAFQKLNLVQVALSEAELKEKIQSFYRGQFKKAKKLSDTASGELLSSIKDFLT